MGIDCLDPDEQPEIDQPRNEDVVMKCSWFLLKQQCHKKESIERSYQKSIFHDTNLAILLYDARLMSSGFHRL